MIYDPANAAAAIDAIDAARARRPDPNAEPAFAMFGTRARR